MDALRAGGAPWPGAVAVSGGSDSLALMHLLADWARLRAFDPPVVLAVDHQLQPGSAALAREVAARANEAGLEANVLAWKGAKPKADLEAEARAARYRLMGSWLSKRGMRGLYVAHTRDDQAETFLLRLARGSGLDGLASMAPLAPFPLADSEGLVVVRPLLDVPRDALRLYLESHGFRWFDDPMNADPRFARNRIRAAWPDLESLGLGRDRIADAAAHLGRVREALDSVTLAVMRRAVQMKDGRTYVDAEALAQAPHEVGLRALARLLMVVGAQSYRPRFAQLERLFDRIAQANVGAGCTLHGCRIALAPKRDAVFGRGTLVLTPEARAGKARKREPSKPRN